MVHYLCAEPAAGIGTIRPELLRDTEEYVLVIAGGVFPRVCLRS